MKLRLKEAREAAFLSQRDLAKIAGVSHVTISRLETGKNRPTFKTARKLAKALRVTPRELVAREE